ncbi:MAG TPA: OsmC family protein [Pseudidiomarina sp.]|nr:OsmC family protein [Pseudidiomarina sp.]
MSNQASVVNLRLVEGYKFEVDFGDYGTITTDEPEPLGSGSGPSPSQLLAAAVANCMAASLMFAIRKYKGDPGQMRAQVTATTDRVDGRLRVTHLDVDLRLGNPAIELPQLDKILAQFEDFCVVTQSVRQGIEVTAKVHDSTGMGVRSSTK